MMEGGLICKTRKSPVPSHDPTSFSYLIQSNTLSLSIEQ